MKVIKYLDPFMDVVGIGPETSLCTKSSVEATLLSFPTSYLRSGCLPTKQPLQAPSDDLMRGNTSTISSFCSCWRYLKFRWTNLWCQILLVSLAWVNRELWYEWGRKCENSYALKAWFAAPFTIRFPVDIFEIYTKSGWNMARFGEPVWVIKDTKNIFSAMEDTYRTLLNTPCSNLIEPFPPTGVWESCPMWMLGPLERSR